MNTSNISGDAKIVMGAPMPTENSMDIPPKKEGQKVIEEGDIELNVEKNTPELLAQLNAQYKKQKIKSTDNKGR